MFLSRLKTLFSDVGGYERLGDRTYIPDFLTSLSVSRGVEHGSQASPARRSMRIYGVACSEVILSAAKARAGYIFPCILPCHGFLCLCLPILPLPRAPLRKEDFTQTFIKIISSKGSINQTQECGSRKPTEDSGIYAWRSSVPHWLRDTLALEDLSHLPDFILSLHTCENQGPQVSRGSTLLVPDFFSAQFSPKLCLWIAPLWTLSQAPRWFQYSSSIQASRGISNSHIPPWVYPPGASCFWQWGWWRRWNGRGHYWTSRQSPVAVPDFWCLYHSSQSNAGKSLEARNESLNSWKVSSTFEFQEVLNHRVTEKEKLHKKIMKCILEIFYFNLRLSKW